MPQLLDDGCDASQDGWYCLVPRRPRFGQFVLNCYHEALRWIKDMLNGHLFLKSAFFTLRTIGVINKVDDTQNLSLVVTMSHTIVLYGSMENLYKTDWCFWLTRDECVGFFRLITLNLYSNELHYEFLSDIGVSFIHWVEYFRQANHFSIYWEWMNLHASHFTWRF